jgi:hypothetical protein
VRAAASWPAPAPPAAPRAGIAQRRMDRHGLRPAVPPYEQTPDAEEPHLRGRRGAAGKIAFGVSDTLQCLEMGAVETLIVWENLEARARPPAARRLVGGRYASITERVSICLLGKAAGETGEACKAQQPYS